MKLSYPCLLEKTFIILHLRPLRLTLFSRLAFHSKLSSIPSPFAAGKTICWRRPFLLRQVKYLPLAGNLFHCHQIGKYIRSHNVTLPSQLKILWFNWRDIANPNAGGAEVFTHEVAKRLVRKGHSITLFTPTFPGCNKDETTDGLHIVRGGGMYTVYNKAKSYFISHQEEYDLIVDEINTRPFMTPKYVKGIPILALIHQLAREFWFYETPFPINYIGFHYLEKHWLSYYRNTITVTVSSSSKRDLESMGFKCILIVPEGLSFSPLQQVPPKDKEPTIVFIGRLKKAKLPDHALKAFALIREKIPDAKMGVIGDGYLLEELKKTLGTSRIKFYGKVSNENRNDLVSKAHMILVPAVREGWGLVVTESNAVGTPAIGYNVHGLRDSIIDGKTGIILKKNSPEELATQAIKLLGDRDLLHCLSNNALEFSRRFKWDISAEEFDKALRHAANRFQESSPIKH